MRDGVQALAEADELGVVDPIRPPAFLVALLGRIRALPPYAIAFLLIAIVRAVADLSVAIRSLGVPDMSFPILGLLLGSVPDWLTLLIPVAVGWSTVRLGSASGRVVRGAIAVGLSEVARMAGSLLSGPEMSSLLMADVVRAVAVFLLAGGLIWMAHGVEALRRSAPTSTARRVAVGAIILGLVAAAVELVARLAQLASSVPPMDGEDFERAIFTSNAAGLAHVLVLLAWAYLAWVLIRGDGDAGRPASATRMGSASGWFAIGWFAASIAALAAVPFAIEAPDGPAGPSTASLILWITTVAGATCVLISMAALAAGLRGGLATESLADDAYEQAGTR
jgi:hypothetical protein